MGHAEDLAAQKALAARGPDGSSHRGEASIRRLQKLWPTLRLIHLPLHASRLNQIEIYFSIVQRKVLTPNDFANLELAQRRVLDFQDHFQQIATPFELEVHASQPERAPQTTRSPPPKPHSRITNTLANFRARALRRRHPAGPLPRSSSVRQLSVTDHGIGGQGRATPQEMRTQPLWGLRVIETFLHGGNAVLISEAIERHRGQGQAAATAFNNLSSTQRNQILAFLNSL